MLKLIKPKYIHHLRLIIIMSQCIKTDDYRCPCCMNFIYIRYICDNKHSICGNCYMKISKCPLCRCENIKKTDIDTQNILNKECKNKINGCSLVLYQFDNEHEEDCLYNPMQCKFCHINILNNHVADHFEHFCVNQFKISTYMSNNTKSETTGRKYVVNGKTELSLFDIDGEYIVIVVPKMLQKKFDFYVFSTNNKYRLSNYKINILSPAGNTLSESSIYYRKMHSISISFDSLDNMMSFVLQNMFIINRREKSKTIDNVIFFETFSVEGEPGSAGNWTYEDYTNIINMFGV